MAPLLREYNADNNDTLVLTVTSLTVVHAVTLEKEKTASNAISVKIAHLFLDKKTPPITITARERISYPFPCIKRARLAYLDAAKASSTYFCTLFAASSRSMLVSYRGFTEI